jgi:hypothetical protein
VVVIRIKVKISGEQSEILMMVTVLRFLKTVDEEWGDEEWD